jgi:hypothetical protein
MEEGEGGAEKEGGGCVGGDLTSEAMVEGVGVNPSHSTCSLDYLSRS